MNGGSRPSRFVVAIDGPGGSGKSTVASAVAAELGVESLDTGAMYRAVTAAVLHAGVDPDADEAVAAVAERADMTFEVDRVTIDGRDVTAEIRGEAVTAAVSAVAANPAVRGLLRDAQRAWAAARDRSVVEGRDIGTVVFPDADLKIFLTATPAVRASRRAKQSGDPDLGYIEADLARRDRHDSTREDSPLAIADDALVIDTSERTLDEVIAAILEALHG